MKDYIHANMIAYEDIAEEFQTKKSVRLKADAEIADKFRSFLREGDNVLELGVGSGQISRLLCEHHLNVDAIEYAPRMARLAKLTAPNAHIIVDEFLGHNFGDKKYDGIIGIAFIHLFNAKDAKQVMDKISALLALGGKLMLATTVHDRTFDDVARKTNFKKAAHRFRRHYTFKDFESLFINTGFSLESTTLDDDGEVARKRWVNIVGFRQ